MAPSGCSPFPHGPATPGSNTDARGGKPLLHATNTNTKPTSAMRTPSPSIFRCPPPFAASSTLRRPRACKPDATSVSPDGVRRLHGPIRANKRPPKVRPEDSGAGFAWRDAGGPAASNRHPRIGTSTYVADLGVSVCMSLSSGRALRRYKYPD